MRRRAARAAALALVVVLLAPAAAQAHALLEGTVPERGAHVDRAPAQVVLRFDESVDASLGGVKVFDARGREVQQGTAFHPGGRGTELGIRLPGGLPDGGYTATFRVISADSHPISGGFTFTVGDGAAGAASVADLLEGQSAGPVTSTAFSIVRAAQYAAIALGLGTVVFLLACWLPGLAAVAGEGGAWPAAAEAFARRTRALLVAAAATGAVSGLLGIVLQGAQGEGRSLWSALRGDVVGGVLSTRFGTVWGVAVLLWLLVGAWALARLPRPGAALAVPAAALALLALLPALSGHPSAQSPVGLLVPANALHVLAMAAWLGGIGVLVLALRAATTRLEPAERTPLLVAVVARFSTLAGVALGVLFVSGVIQSVVEVASFGAMLDTAFGRAVLIKLALFGGLIALGWINRSRLLPALRASGESPRRAGVLLRRTLRAELLLGVAVLGVTGALAGYPPSTAVSAGPVTREADVGPARLQATVDPAAVGPNELHVYLFDRATGAQFTAAKEVRVTADLPDRGIADLPFDVRAAGPGHVTGSGALPVAGEWHLTVTVRVSEFDEFAAHLTMPVR